jgi:hypothetical protein
VNSLTAITRLIGGHTYAIAALAVIAALTVWLITRAVRKAPFKNTPAAVVMAGLAAMACTGYSGDTSWRFAGDHLGMHDIPERAALFAAGELALFSVALMARQNLKTESAPGFPGLLVWVITGVQVIPAFSESGFWAGIVRAFLGPILGALLWHLAMGIELRHAKPGAKSNSFPSILARELRERALSWLGLAVRDRSAEQITRDRWTVRAVALAARLAEFTPAKRTGLRGRFLAHRLSVAVGKAQAGAHPQQRQVLLDLLAARRHATSLATVMLPSPWDADLSARTALPAADTDGGHEPRTTVGQPGGQAPDMLPVPLPGQARTALRAAPDIVSAARADTGADNPLISKDKGGKPRTTPNSRADKTADTGEDKPSMAALVRSSLDNGIDDPDKVVSAVLAVHPDADTDNVKRTLRREKNKRTDYL